MKKLFLILALLASLGVEAQEGFFYCLPRTVLKLEVTIEETHYQVGPYSEFAAEMLGTTDYIKENKTEAIVKSVDIQLGSEADPHTARFIEFDEKSKEPVPNIILDCDGIIKAVGYNTLPQDFNIEKNTVVYTNNDMKPEATVSFVELIEEQDNEDEEEGEEEEGKKTPKKPTKKDKAKTIIDKISKIRNAYFDLMSGVNETNYGNTISYMAESMQNLENEYISLFKGKTVTTTYKRYFYIKPANNEANATVSCGKLDNGEALKVQFETKNASFGLEPLSDDQINTEQPNKVFYRIPEQSNVTVTLGKNVLASKTLVISQFGALRLISAKNNKIMFNPNTGQIISLTH